LSKDDHLELDGIVLAARGNGNFLVRINDSDTEVNCSLSGKIRKNTIRILEGDHVKIKVSPYDMTRGFVTFRSKSNGEQQ
jgi:translation initiation factor IF-1